MDVLNVQTIWIGNRCYRKNPMKNGRDNYNPEDDFYDDGISSSAVFQDDEICDSNLDIEETSRGLRLSLSIPRDFYKFIIGKKGQNKKRIETETHTQIIVPKQEDRRQELVINGHDRAGIVSAKTRIDVLIDSARQQLPFTHFLSIPVTEDEVVMGFEDFRFQVLNQCDGDAGLDASLFQNPKKLHLTLGTLVLLNDAEVEAAATLLDLCREELVRPILKGEHLQVEMRGLEYMNDDPGAVDVLYAKVDAGPACDRLQILVDRFVDKFTGCNLMQREHDRVKLHMTVMNTLMRKDPSGAFEPQPEKNTRFGNKPRESFDASRVLKKFGDFDFGPLHISQIHLSQRYSTGSDGYYQCAAAIKLPD